MHLNEFEHVDLAFATFIKERTKEVGNFDAIKPHPNNAKFAKVEQLIAQQKYADARPKLEGLDQANFPQASYYLGLIYMNGLTIKILTLVHWRQVW